MWWLFLICFLSILLACRVVLSRCFYHSIGEFQQIASVHIGTLRRTCAEVAAGEVNGGGGKSMGPRRQGDGGKARGHAPASPTRRSNGEEGAHGACHRRLWVLREQGGERTAEGASRDWARREDSDDAEVQRWRRECEGKRAKKKSFHRRVGQKS
jgi:hypothetical protein